MMKLFFFCFSCIALFGDIDLSTHETSLYSEHGEDGVIAHLLQKIGTTSRYFVELGASDGITHSNAYLLLLQGWDGLSLDRAHSIPAYNLHKEFITKDNVNALFSKYKVPQNLDILSIRTSYNAFHIWNGLSYEPAIVVVTMNGLHPPDTDRVALYHPFYVGDKSDYYGASILSFYKLGRAKGYSLVYADQSGHTLFFIRDDVIRDQELVFKDINNVEALYRPITENVTPDSLNRSFTTADEILNR